MSRNAALVPLTSMTTSSHQELLRLATVTSNLQGALGVDAFGRVTSLVDPAYMSLYADTDVYELLAVMPADLLLPVSYVEGYPTLHGTPVWERLEGEPVEYYEYFKRYRELKAIYGSRSTMRVAYENDVLGPYMHTISELYHWAFRCKAYDLYREAERQAMLHNDQIELLGEHKQIAQSLAQVCMDHLVHNQHLLTPKTALMGLQLATQLQRLSVGLDPKAPDTAYRGSGGGAPNITIQNNVAGAGDVVGIQQPSSPTHSQGGPQTGGSPDAMGAILSVLQQVGAFDPPEAPAAGSDPDYEVVE